MKKYFLGFLAGILILTGGVVVWQSSYFGKIVRNIALLPSRQEASLAALVQSPFYYSFKVDGVLDEAGKMDDSSSPYFWLNSGGQFILKNGIGKTVQGKLNKFNKWRLAYYASNPIDTDDGYHPQNILRLVTRSKWQNFRQEIYYRIMKDNLSTSPNRNASNGLLLFNRYINGNNLYYTGIRVDGTAVIKKKINGTYYTMAQKPLFSGAKYDRNSNPNLLPKNVWIGLRSEVKTNNDGTVSVKLFMDNGKTGNWILIAEAKDDARSYGGAVISSEGYAGARTDFMDVEFDDYRIVKI